MNEMLRSPRDEDAATVAGLMSRDWPDPIDTQSVLRSWTSPGIDRELDVRLGQACYAIVHGLDRARVWLDIRGHPSGELLDWAEARATERGRRIFAGAWSTNESLLGVLVTRGFWPVRYSQRMEIDLGALTPEPSWPEGVQVRTFRFGDERAFYELHQETFREFRHRGLRRAGLGVDAESLTGANRLYEETGMKVSARFDIFEKVIA